jgi:hypothetical protein
MVGTSFWGARMIPRQRVTRAMFVVGISAVARLALAATPPVHAVDIPAEDLGTALLEYARATHEQIAFDGALVAGYRSTAISGAYTVTQGLQALVGTAPFLIRTTSLGVLTLVATPPAHAPGEAGVATAGPPSAPADATSSTSKVSQEVTVIARRAKLESKVRTFVDEISTMQQGAGGSHWGGEGLARWSVPVCSSVTGLSARDVEFIRERISEIGRTAGVPLAGERCRPNLFVFLTGEPQQLLKAMAGRNRAVTFGRASPLAIDAFIAMLHPVKVWYNTHPVTPDSTAAGRGFPNSSFVTDDSGTGAGALAEVPGADVPVTSDWERASHVTATVVWTFSYVYVIVDQNQIHALTLGQIADYVGMVGLAELKPTARLADAPTILRLFGGVPQEAPAGMTEWDRAYLKSLYATEQSSKVQRDLIAKGMLREIVR